MATINYRTIDADNSHLRFNTLVTAGEIVIEFARFGSVLVNRETAVIAIAETLLNEPDLKIKTESDFHGAINRGLRYLTQFALQYRAKKPLKTAQQSETTVNTTGKF